MRPIAGNGSERRFFCVHYSDCLNETIRQGWKGFSCVQCDGYEPEITDNALVMLEAARCVRLIVEIFDPCRATERASQNRAGEDCQSRSSREKSCQET